jgi:hypothetical protein
VSEERDRRMWRGSSESDRRRAMRLGIRWAAPYIVLDKTREYDNVGVGMSWTDNEDGDLLDEAFDNGLRHGLATLSVERAQQIMDGSQPIS